MMGVTRPSRAFLAAACLAASAEATSATAGGGLSSSDLLKEGFKLVAEGDLMTVRGFSSQKPTIDPGILVYGPSPTPSNCQLYDNLVAVVALSHEGYRCRPIAWVYHRYDEYIRLKRGKEEFVCVLGQSEDCYRAYSSIQ
ncbi:hypothetical protein [Mesorhizobium sp.]|uniref:hypothetical protein n=1 Tax=Mesorhizobium sp. TaxID=1871066 RepID=UPI000FEA21EC|nr:hypothetical protein [Mesorhizobium sp.]RWA99196.1 MAG: hypothetical protein EOQ33_24695 [Mesorhizobium sp.]